jgi:hypothetical protein
MSMKTKADLLAHITALTESGDEAKRLEWFRIRGTEGFAATLPSSPICRAICTNSNLDIRVFGHEPVSVEIGPALYQLIDSKQPLPEWAQKVGE